MFNNKKIVLVIFVLLIGIICWLVYLNLSNNQVDEKVNIDSNENRQEVVVDKQVVNEENKQKDTAPIINVNKDIALETLTPVVPPILLDGKKFKLAYYNDQNTSELKDISLSFSGGIINAYFCNSMSGKYKLSDSILSASVISSSSACITEGKSIDKNKIEDSFKKSLYAGFKVAFDGQLLTLLNNDQKFVFELQ